MSKKPLFRLAVLVAAMMCALGAAAVEAYANFTPSNSTLTFYCDNLRSTRPGTTYDLNEGANHPVWCTDNTFLNVTRVAFDSSFSDARPTSTNRWFYGMDDLQAIDGISYLNTSEVTDMTLMFCKCIKLTHLDLTHFNTANVTTMAWMFSGCTGLTSLDVGSFNTANLTDMNGMFYGCSSLTSLDVSNLNTANVTNMADLFSACTSLASIDVSTFNTANVTVMNEMFCGCDLLDSIDLSNFITDKLEEISDMFANCPNLEYIDLSSFNTSSVISAVNVFGNCPRLKTLDLSSFNTANMKYMIYMFHDCPSLETIYVGDGWSVESVSVGWSMFDNCTSLVGGQGTTFDANHTDVSYAHIDGGPSNPGYFTAKNAGLRGDVDGDGEVGISDVTALVDYLLSKDAEGINLKAADVNQDGSVNIADVTDLIDYLLAKSWD